MSYAPPVLLIAIPLLTAFLIPLLSLVYRQIGRFILPLLMLSLVIISASLIPAVMKQGYIIEHIVIKPPFGINLVVGHLGLVLTLLISVIGFLVSLYSFSYAKTKGIEPMSRYSVLFSLIVMGAIGIVLTGDVFNLFVFFEIMSISAYSLTAIKKDSRSLEASIKYILIGSISSVFILLGIALIYSHTGTLNIAQIGERFSEVNSTVRAFIFVVFFIGFGIEAELFPLNFWVPDVYTASGNQVTAIFSGVTVKAGLYALIRFYFLIYTKDGLSSTVILILAILTLIIAEIIALRQKNIKRMLAYSSMGQIGLIMLVFSLGKSGISPGLLHMVNHSIIKTTLFLTVGYMSIRAGTDHIAGLKGIARRMPITGVIFTVASLSVMGFPLFNGFVSKIYILKAFAYSKNLLPVAVILLASLIEVVYYFRVIQIIYSKQNENEIKPKPKWEEAPIIALIPILILGLAIIFLGVYPDLIMDFIDKAAKELINTASYIKAVL